MDGLLRGIGLGLIGWRQRLGVVWIRLSRLRRVAWLWLLIGLRWIALRLLRLIALWLRRLLRRVALRWGRSLLRVRWIALWRVRLLLEAIGLRGIALREIGIRLLGREWLTVVRIGRLRWIALLRRSERIRAGLLLLLRIRWIALRRLRWLRVGWIALWRQWLIGIGVLRGRIGLRLLRSERIDTRLRGRVLLLLLVGTTIGLRIIQRVGLRWVTLLIGWIALRCIRLLWLLALLHIGLRWIALQLRCIRLLWLITLILRRVALLLLVESLRLISLSLRRRIALRLLLALRGSVRLLIGLLLLETHQLILQLHDSAVHID